MVMWVLVFLHLMHGKMEYYQLGTFETQNACYAEKENAKTLVKDRNSGVLCLEVTLPNG